MSSVVMATRSALPPQLDDAARKGRYGVAYLDTIVTNAGFDFNEPRPGADMLAFDAGITYPEGVVRVQIKTTHRYEISGTNERLTYTATQHWVDSWAGSLAPVYFVVVVVPRTNDGGTWLDHHATGTTLAGTAAYWSRIEASQFGPDNMSLAALRSQRVDGATLLQWQQDLIQDYGG